MNWTLIVVGVVILLSALLGAYKGIIRMAFSLVAIILVIIATSFLAPRVSVFLEDHTKLDNYVYDKTEAYFEDKGFITNADTEIDIKSLPLPKVMLDQLEKDAGTYVDKGVVDVNKYIARTLSNFIFSMIVYIVLFLVLWIVAKIIEMQLDFFSKIPVIKQLNAVAGFGVGALKGLILVWVVFLFISIFSNSAFAHMIIGQVKENAILTYMYDKNVLLHIYLALK